MLTYNFGTKILVWILQLKDGYLSVVLITDKTYLKKLFESSLLEKVSVKKTYNELHE